MLREWLAEFAAFEAGNQSRKMAETEYIENEHQTRESIGRQLAFYFARWHGNPPQVEYYRPAWTVEEADHYQVYENATEGTPVSPVFATLAEVRAWLIDEGYTEFAADLLIRTSWEPSFYLTMPSDPPDKTEAPFDAG